MPDLGAALGGRSGRVFGMEARLAGRVPLEAIIAALQEFRAEGQRLSTALRAVELVESALHR